MVEAVLSQDTVYAGCSVCAMEVSADEGGESSTDRAGWEA